MLADCRGIEPCKGLWTIPAGFMEIGESSAAGAARETLEEANAAVHILGPYAHLDIPVIGQVRSNTVFFTRLIANAVCVSLVNSTRHHMIRLLCEPPCNQKLHCSEEDCIPTIGIGSCSFLMLSMRAGVMKTLWPYPACCHSTMSPGAEHNHSSRLNPQSRVFIVSHLHAGIHPV